VCFMFPQTTVWGNSCLGVASLRKTQEILDFAVFLRNGSGVLLKSINGRKKGLEGVQKIFYHSEKIYTAFNFWDIIFVYI